MSLLLQHEPVLQTDCLDCSDKGESAQMLIKMIARSADAGPGGWVGLKRKLLHLDVDGSGAINAEGAAHCQAFSTCHTPAVHGAGKFNACISGTTHVRSDFANHKCL